MDYYKQIDNGYIMSIGTGGHGTEITEQEYNTILSVIANKPTPTESVDYRLKADLTWERYEVEPVEEDATAEEVLAILTGETE